MTQDVIYPGECSVCTELGFAQGTMPNKSTPSSLFQPLKILKIALYSSNSSLLKATIPYSFNILWMLVNNTSKVESKKTQRT